MPTKTRTKISFKIDLTEEGTRALVQSELEKLVKGAFGCGKEKRWMGKRRYLEATADKEAFEKVFNTSLTEDLKGNYIPRTLPTYPDSLKQYVSGTPAVININRKPLIFY